MNILAVDDEKLALEGIVKMLKDTVPDAQIRGFRKAEDALEYAKTHTVDIAFLDIEMRGMNGNVLAKKLQDIQPQINIIFTTGYIDYMKEAFDLHASGYILKPITEKKIRKELAHLRYPTDQIKAPGEADPAGAADQSNTILAEVPSNAADPKAFADQDDRIHIRAFGNFEVYYHGVPLYFKYQKTKELLAYLVDRRGALCGLQEISAVLWEGDAGQSHVSYLKNLRSDLTEALDNCDNGHILVRRRGQIGLLPSEVDCDFFTCMETGNMDAYFGEYMSQYSWSEFTHGMLEERKKSS